MFGEVRQVRKKLAGRARQFAPARQGRGSCGGAVGQRRHAARVVQQHHHLQRAGGGREADGRVVRGDRIVAGHRVSRAEGPGAPGAWKLILRSAVALGGMGLVEIVSRKNRVPPPIAAPGTSLIVSGLVPLLAIFKVCVTSAGFWLISAL